MENKIIKYGDTEFTFTYDKSLLNKKKNRFLKKYASLEAEFLGDIDRTVLTKYETRIKELQLAINTTKEDAHKEILEKKLNEVIESREADPKVIAVRKQISICSGLILNEICEDREFTKPFLKDVLVGDTSLIDHDSEQGQIFIMEVTINFLALMVPSMMKLKPI